MKHIESVLIILYTPEIWIARISHCTRNFVVYLLQRLSREKSSSSSTHAFLHLSNALHSLSIQNVSHGPTLWNHLSNQYHHIKRNAIKNLWPCWNRILDSWKLHSNVCCVIWLLINRTDIHHFLAILHGHHLESLFYKYFVYYVGATVRNVV